MTTKDAYQYFVLRAQEIAISKNWTPVNWYYVFFNTNFSNIRQISGNDEFLFYNLNREETFNTFPEKLNPRTVVHNW